MYIYIKKIKKSTKRNLSPKRIARAHNFQAHHEVKIGIFKIKLKQAQEFWEQSGPQIDSLLRWDPAGPSFAGLGSTLRSIWK